MQSQYFSDVATESLGEAGDHILVGRGFDLQTEQREDRLAFPFEPKYFERKCPQVLICGKG